MLVVQTSNFKIYENLDAEIFISFVIKLFNRYLTVLEFEKSIFSSIFLDHTKNLFCNYQIYVYYNYTNISL